MSAPPPSQAHVRAGVAELVGDLARTSVTDCDPDALTHRICVELAELCGLAACVAALLDDTASVRTLIGSRPEAEQLTRLVRQFGVDVQGGQSALARPPRYASAEDLTGARTVVAEAAAKVGLPVTASVGLYRRDRPVGNLQLFADRPGALPDELLRELVPLADALGTAVHDASAYQYSTQLVAGLSEALEGQRPVEQAKGVLAERHEVDLDTAYRMLRDQARRRNTSVTLLAAEVVSPHWRHAGEERTNGRRPDTAESTDSGTAPLPAQRRVPENSPDGRA
jgi:hypothetical protein